MGGHAVNDVVRINQNNVEDTLNSLQTKILDDLGIVIGESAKVLGSTGKRHPGDSSGDIDVAVSMDAVKSKLGIQDDDEVIDAVKDAIREVTPDIMDNRKAGMIHFSFPIENTDGRQKKEKVQTDFMLVSDDDLNYVDFGYWSPSQWESEYKGAFRTIALMMIAAEGGKKVLKTQPNKQGEDVPVEWERMIFDPRKGLFKAVQTNLSKKTGNITRSNRTLSKDLITNDPDTVVKKLLGKSAEIEDSQSFENIIEAINSRDFAHKSSRDKILNRIGEEITKQFKIPENEIKELLGVQTEELTEASKGVDATKGVSHLEFIDDMIFNLGAEGLDLAVDTSEKMLNDLSKEGNVGDEIHKSSKIDGCIHPDTLIKTTDGYIKIKNLIGSDITYTGFGYNEKTGKIESTKLEHPRINNNDKCWVEVTFTNDKSLIVTMDHEFYTTNRGWVEAQNLTETDDVFEIK